MSREKCICGERGGRRLFVAEGFPIIRCLRCGQIRTITPPGLHRRGYYNNSDAQGYLKKQEMYRELFRNVLRFVKQFRTRGRLLDIGAGIGLLVDEARRLGFEAYGFEPSQSAVHIASRRFDIPLIASEFKPSLISNPVDIVVINHVLEHVKYPTQLLKHVHQVLSTQGLLVVGVPNFDSFLARIKRDRWQSLIPDQHRWHFTLRTLDQFILQFGFVRIGQTWENHDRTMHNFWKKPIYWVLDEIALFTGFAEAMLIVYEKRRVRRVSQNMTITRSHAVRPPS